MDPSLQDMAYMTIALQLAAQGRATVSPNPMVGCVLVKEGEVIAQGFHQSAGEPHAEIHALNQAGEHARGAIAYVTLEPCCHYGRTPPCTERLISAGIKKVYVACLDPNPLVSGKGVTALEEAGIEVEVGCCEEQAKKLNEIFFHYIKTKTPFVIAKWAMSLDGKTMTASGDQKQISSLDSKKHTHQQRQYVDAIMVGARTLRSDDPMLTARYEPIEKQPLRIVLAGRQPLPKTAQLFDVTSEVKTLVVSPVKQDLPSHIEVLVLPDKSGEKVDIKKLCLVLGERGVTSVLLEGGETLHASFFSEKLVNKIQAYLAPYIISDLPTKQRVQELKCEPLGDDFLFEASI